jgi:hypothetical protein
VQEVGLEAMELVFDEFGVAPEDGVEGEIFFHADRGDRTWQLEGAEVAVVDDKGFPGSGADAEERELVALGVGDEVAAGVGDPVDFVEGIGEIGNAREPHGSTVPRVYNLECEWPI